ncbi:hypothetical protein SAMN05216273_106120 [Chryseobacterium taihuense]|uniref:Cardiolipin synthase N-terminal domain-containing protein n=1 Tax=Chryseobacterium taihuense TaxID=1141221 RepID=A0ABY0QSY7_9FLAO|nr:hypothetical protein SAMN05216273_106120 [Chryseobacterium taihuense]
MKHFSVITPNIILLVAFTLLVLYLLAVYFLVRNKSGFIPVIILIIFPIIGPLAIILRNLTDRK